MEPAGGVAGKKLLLTQRRAKSAEQRVGKSRKKAEMKPGKRTKIAGARRRELFLFVFNSPLSAPRSLPVARLFL
jgi:hypothetical protein